MIWVWIAFIAFVLLMLALDLDVFHRKAHVVSVREALAWSTLWLGMGLVFAVFVYFAYGGQWFGLGTAADTVDGLMNDEATATEKYLTGHVVEKSLSVDKIFAIAMIFGFFAVAPLCAGAGCGHDGVRRGRGGVACRERCVWAAPISSGC